MTRFETDLKNMQDAIIKLKDAARKSPHAGEIHDGGNFVVIEFVSTYEAATFAREYEPNFDIMFDGRHPMYLASDVHVVFTWK